MSGKSYTPETERSTDAYGRPAPTGLQRYAGQPGYQTNPVEKGFGFRPMPYEPGYGAPTPMPNPTPMPIFGGGGKASPTDGRSIADAILNPAIDIMKDQLTKQLQDQTNRFIPPNGAGSQQLLDQAQQNTGFNPNQLF